MAGLNQFVDTNMVTSEALLTYENSLNYTPNMYRGYEKQFARAGMKIGETLNIRKPTRFNGRVGQAFAAEGLVDSSIPLTINIQRGVDWLISSRDLALHFDEYRERYIIPAMAALANLTDRDAALLMHYTCPNFVGTPGTAITTVLPYFQAKQKMQEFSVPADGMNTLVMNPAQSVNLASGLTTLFNPTGQISKQYETGGMENNGTVAGFRDWKMDQNSIRGVVGTYSGTPVINGAGQTGSVLVTSGWTAASFLNAGDKFTMAGVNAANAQPPHQDTGSLQQFVVQSTATADGSGNMSISIYPPINPSGQFQNVTASPAANAALTVWGASGQSYGVAVGFHRNAFTAAFVDLDLPGGIHRGSMQRDPQTNISLRYIEQYWAGDDQWRARFDLMYGMQALYPEWGCSIATN